MSSLTADNTLLAFLKQATKLTEIRDPAGNVVGYFAPIALDQGRLYAEIAAHCDLEEIERRKVANLPGCTTRQLFEHLLSLTQDESMRSHLQQKIDRLAEREVCDTP